jgi:hypothetical protein
LGWGKKFTTPARIAISSENVRLFTPICSTIYQVIEAIYLHAIVCVLLINSHPRIATPAPITGN